MESLSFNIVNYVLLKYISLSDVKNLRLTNKHLYNITKKIFFDNYYFNYQKINKHIICQYEIKKLCDVTKFDFAYDNLITHIICHESFNENINKQCFPKNLINLIFSKCFTKKIRDDFPLSLQILKIPLRYNQLLKHRSKNAQNLNCTYYTIYDDFPWLKQYPDVLIL